MTSPATYRCTACGRDWLERTLLRFGEPGADALAQARREARR